MAAARRSAALPSMPGRPTLGVVQAVADGVPAHRADRWRMSREPRIADIRWLREVARNAGTALVLTSRRARQAGRDAGTGPIHWADEAFDDVADVAIELAVDEGSPGRSATVRARGRGYCAGTVRVGV